jgi:hypothetical protein
MNDTLDAMIANLLRETSGWESIEVQVEISQTLHVAIGRNLPVTGTKIEHLIETAAGQRFFKMKGCAPEEACAFMAGYRDGKRCAYVESKRPPHESEQKSITITKSFMNEQLTGFRHGPSAVALRNFVGLIPIHQALPKAIRMGQSRVMERPCEIFRFPRVPTSQGTCELVYHLDSVTSIPLKVEIFADDSMITAQTPSSIWEATSFDTIQGFHVALNSKYDSFIQRDDRHTHQLTEVQKVKTIAFNQKYDSSTFWPTYQPSVYINDLIQRNHYFNTPNKKAPESITTTPDAQAIIGGPQDTIFSATYLGLGVGITCLCIGMILWIQGIKRGRNGSQRGITNR